MKIKTENITPEIAARYFVLNFDKNRKFRPNYGAKLRDAFSRGEYRKTHQGIAFDDNGRLIDGQHRMWAISQLKSGVFPMVVARGLPTPVFEVIDGGEGRSIADRLHEDRRLVEVARLMVRTAYGKGGSITATSLKPFIEVITPLHGALIAFCPSTARTWSTAPVRLAAVAHGLIGTDFDYVKHVYRALVHCEVASMPPVAGALYRSFQSGTLSTADVVDVYARAMVVFDPSKANVTKIQVKDVSVAVGRLKVALNGALMDGRHKSVGTTLDLI